MYWKIELLGGISAVVQDQGEGRILQRFRTRKTATLLAYLAFYGDRPHPREKLIELFWPDAPLHTARASLNTALHALRHDLESPGHGGSLLAADRQTVQLRREALETDVAAFIGALDAARRGPGPARKAHLERAVELYRGELCAGYYDDWIVREQSRLAEMAQDAFRELIAVYEGEGDLSAALSIAQRAVTLDPLRESAHEQVMRLHVKRGELPLALRQYRELTLLLREQLDVPASPELQEYAAHLRAATSRRAEPSAAADGASGTVLEDGAGTPAHQPGGALEIRSAMYVERSADHELRSALQQRHSVVLLKGSRQCGKSSLLARGLEQAREAGVRVVLTDLQALSELQFATMDSLLRALAESVAEQLGLEAELERGWDLRRGPNLRFSALLRREILRPDLPPLVWGLDEADRLFAHDHGMELFALFRSWHNERALHPETPWTRLTLVIAYSTEADLFIRDPSLSPFNVGTRVEIDDFTREQVHELHLRYGAPLTSEGLERLYELLNGHPFMLGLALYELSRGRITLEELETSGTSETGIFGDHIRPLWRALNRETDLVQALRALVANGTPPSESTFYRLRSAGFLRGDSVRTARFRCNLCRRFLQERFAPR